MFPGCTTESRIITVRAKEVSVIDGSFVKYARVGVTGA